MLVQIQQPPHIGISSNRLGSYPDKVITMVQVHVCQLYGVNSLKVEHFTVNEVYIGSIPI